MPLNSEMRTNGYYWFIEPLFREFREQTGQYVDLYGNASFAGNDLLALEQILQQALTLIEAQPESWAVIVGHAGARGEVYMGVLKTRFIALLTQWLQLCSDAQQSNSAVVCFGD